MSHADKMQNALVKATIIGKGNTFTSIIESSTDLPSDAMGEVVTDVLQKAWQAGEEPMNCVVVLTFDVTEATEGQAVS